MGRVKRKTRGKDSLIKNVHRKQLAKETKAKVREGRGCGKMEKKQG